METWDGLRLSISGWDQTRPNQTLTGNGLSAQNSSPRLRTGGYSGEELTPDLGGSWRNTNDRLTDGTFATSWPAQQWGPSCDQRNIGYEKERVALRGTGTLSFSKAFILGGGGGGQSYPIQGAVKGTCRCGAPPGGSVRKKRPREGVGNPGQGQLEVQNCCRTQDKPKGVRAGEL